jgi:predicted O-methyltransferase YrrM
MAFSCFDLCGPDPNPMTKREAIALQELMASLPMNPVVIQIGAERGCSTLAMLEARGDAFIFSIDINPRPEERDNLAKAHLEARKVVRGLGLSASIGAYWPEDWKCHLLYVDGDHRRPGIDMDIKTWVPYVKDGGIIAFHDFIPPGERGPHIHGRVYEAVVELVDLETILYVGRLKAFRQRL